jgi:hypothetical protein
VSEGDLSAVTDEKLNAHGRKNGVPDDVSHGDQIEAGMLGDEVENGDQEKDHFPPNELRLPPGVILLIMLVIDTTRTIRHRNLQLSMRNDQWKMINAIIMAN